LPPVITQVLRAVARTIPDEQLTARGRELYPHVTVLDGLNADGSATVRSAVEGERPLLLRLGRTSAFRAAETGQPFDVLKVDIESDALVRLHYRLAELLPHSQAFVDYVPHATVAFLQPGAATAYVGQPWLDGWSVVVDRLIFSSRTRQTDELLLQGPPRAFADRSVSPYGRRSQRVAA
jgi:hypothetical protein